MLKLASKKTVDALMEQEADKHYQGVAPDLPRQGNYQWLGAIDHLADWLYDNFRDQWEPGRFKRIAKRVVNQYCSSDTKESRRNEEKAERRWRAKEKAKLNPPRSRPSIEHTWDRKKPTRLGTGSY